MHPDAKNAMRRHVEEALNSSEIHGGRVTITDKSMDALMRFSTAASKQSDPWLHERDGRHIFFDSSNATLEALEPDAGRRAAMDGLLSDVVGADGLISIADSVLDFVESLPRKYAYVMVIHVLTEIT